MTQLSVIEKQNTRQALQWWTQARFGMFIHWGLYAQLAGYWKGQPVPRVGEWIMHFGRISREEYEAIAPTFNPAHFDADFLVRLAKDAGMKYLVITAKHHDGFALYDSPSSDYNIVKRTPFARDPMIDLAAACKTHGIRLCFYYSQSQDWHHPGGLGHWQRGKDWKRILDPAAFDDYLQNKVKPQLRELLTQYGRIGLIWFDTPFTLTRQHSLELKAWVKSFQPDCLVCGRIGNNVGDYHCLGDNMLPITRPKGRWETPATLNDTWGFKSDDHHWKTTRQLLHLLVDLASKGVNYLLNIGPDAQGQVPQPCIDRLHDIGRWMTLNSQAIYSTKASPFALQPAWGRVTQKRKTLFLHVLDWPQGKLQLAGLKSRVKRITLLADPAQPIAFTQEKDEHSSHDLLTITLPSAAPDENVSVLRVDLHDAVLVDDSLLEQPNHPLMLSPLQAVTCGPGRIKHARNGATVAWKDPRLSLQWTVHLLAPGRFRVEIAAAWHGKATWHEGRQLTLQINDQTLQGQLKKNRHVHCPRTQYQKEVISVMGKVHLKHAGPHAITLSIANLPQNDPGVELSHIRLVRMD